VTVDPRSAATTDAEPASEVYFYHLERQPLVRVLPILLERTLERGWRAVVQAGSAERLEALDAELWIYAPDSFLPHGLARDPDAERQPVLLTTAEDNPNGAALRFLVDGAAVSVHRGYVRIVHLFDGNDAEAVEAARKQWRIAKTEGCSLAYWQQDANGRWQRKA
jgi:DNA polymerase-3 subunit chi